VVERQAIGFGTSEGLVVRIDLPLADRFKPDSRHEALTRMDLPVDLERLMINVKRGVIVLAEDALTKPISEEPSRALIARPDAAISRLVSIQLEPDDVVGTGRVKLLLQRRGNNVVRGRDHIGQRADSRDIIADSPKRCYIRHRNRSLFLERPWSASQQAF
jgi:hypothetical protein